MMISVYLCVSQEPPKIRGAFLTQAAAKAAWAMTYADVPNRMVFLPSKDARVTFVQIGSHHVGEIVEIRVDSQPRVLD